MILWLGGPNRARDLKKLACEICDYDNVSCEDQSTPSKSFLEQGNSWNATHDLFFKDLLVWIAHLSFIVGLEPKVRSPGEGEESAFWFSSCFLASCV